MSDHDQIPAFSGSGDPREEALWQAYQAMLRRRNDSRARRWEPAPWPSAPPRAAEPAIEAPSPRAAALGRDGLPSPRRRVAAGTILALAAGATLAVGLWPRDPATPLGAAARRLRVITESRPADVLAARPTLPCFVGGQPMGRLTLDECASRNGVASGPLEVGLDGPANPPATRPPVAPAVAPLVAQAPSPVSPSPLPAPVRPPQPADAPPVFASPPRIIAPPPRLADASPAPRASFWARAFDPPARIAAPRRPVAEPPGAPAAPPPQLALQEPVPRVASGADVEPRPIARISTRRASALAVREFYNALGEGDGARAAAVVIPEKREEGPLSAGELTRFYSSLRGPLRVTRLEPINDDTVFVGYQFVTPDNRLCSGTARVDTIHRDGDTLVRGIRAFNGC